MAKANKLVLTSWSYNEGLIQAAVLPYLKIIHEVDPEGTMFLVTDEKPSLKLSNEQVKNAESLLNTFNIKWLPQNYYNFGLKKIWFTGFYFLRLWWLIISKRIKYIHAFCTPAGSVGYLLSVLTGAKLIIDSYEPHAESMVENGTWSKSSVAFKLLWWLEKKQSQRARWCLGAASGMDGYAERKWGVKLKNFRVRPMCVDLEIFQRNELERKGMRKGFGFENKIVIVYAGKFGSIYYDKEVFDFLEGAWKYWGDGVRVLILSNQQVDIIRSFYKHTGLPESIITIKNVNFKDMPLWLSIGDVALTPVKPVPSKRYCSPIKDGEYWAMGLPVIISPDISDDSKIIAESKTGVIVNFGNKNSFGDKIKEINSILKVKNDEVRKLAIKHRNYANMIPIYRTIYN